MATRREVLLQEARFLNFRTAASFGRQFMKHNMKRSVIFAGAARRALHDRAKTRAAQGAMKNPFIHQGLNAAGKKAIAGQLGKHAHEIDIMQRTGKKLAPVVGAGILGLATAAKGISVYRNYRKKIKEPTRYRAYDVYPEHNYAAVGIQAYNRPYYNDPNRSGPPRDQEAEFGVYEREGIINNIVEALFEG